MIGPGPALELGDDATLRRIGRLIADMAPHPLRTAVRRIDPAAVDTLRPAESALVVHAVPARRAEFASGRAMIRSLLGEPVEIGRHPNGAPILPAGRVGTIAHDATFVVGVVGPSSYASALGIDIEPTVELSAGEADLIVRPDDLVADPVLAFVIKEAVYKAWSSGGGGMLEHHDVRITVGSGDFSAVIRGQVELAGSHGIACDRRIALVVVPARVTGPIAPTS